MLLLLALLACDTGVVEPTVTLLETPCDPASASPYATIELGAGEAVSPMQCRSGDGACSEAPRWDRLPEGDVRIFCEHGFDGVRLLVVYPGASADQP